LAVGAIRGILVVAGVHARSCEVQREDFYKIVYDIHTRYWPQSTPRNLIDAESRRLSGNMAVLADTVVPGGAVVDLGGGWGAFACACAAIGYRETIVDDCGDSGYGQEDKRHRMVKDYGVEVIRRDIVKDGINFAPNSIDAFTSFHSLEHWHNSPRKLFHQVMQALKPGGLLMIGCPNCNDIAKRITVPLGLAEWSPFEAWYNEPMFRSHVREPSVADFYKIAADLGLTQVRVWGTCDSFQLSGRWPVRFMGRIMNYLLSLRPSLCTEIYIAGHKPLSCAPTAT
jgi:SAM-dependent methyltransferase